MWLELLFLAGAHVVGQAPKDRCWLGELVYYPESCIRAVAASGTHSSGEGGRAQGPCRGMGKTIQRKVKVEAAAVGDIMGLHSKKPML